MQQIGAGYKMNFNTIQLRTGSTVQLNPHTLNFAA